MSLSPLIVHNPTGWIDPLGLACCPTILSGNTINKADGSLLIQIPENTEIRKLFPPDNYKGKYGYEYKWIDKDGEKMTVRIHGPDTTAPLGSNANQGWVVGILKGKKSMDINGLFHPQGLFNPSSPYYNSILINEVLIPIEKPLNFPGVP